MKRSIKFTNWILLALLGVIAVYAQPEIVYAQVEPILSILPEQSAVPLGNDIILELSLYAGSEVNAYDLTVQYDPGILTLTEWQHGDYLSNVTVVDIQNDPGSLRLAVTQLATPAVSGNGILLVMTFNVIGIGQSQIEIINALLADSSGNSTEPVLIDGVVAGVDSSTYTPTPMISLTPTPTQSQTLVPTATDTPEPNLTATQGLTPSPTAPAIETEPMSEGQEPIETDTPDVVTTLDEQDGNIGDRVDDDQPPGQDSEGSSDDRTDDERGNIPSEESGSEQASQTSNTDFSQRSGQLSLLLWVVLIASSIAIIVMGLIIIKRKKQKEDGLLL